MNVKNKAIFLDRDGTIIKNITRNGKSFPIDKIKKFKFNYGAIKYLNFLSQYFYLIVISNQPDYKNEGFFELNNMIDFNLKKKIPSLILQYFFGPKNNKKFYKPGNGMVMKYKKKLNLDLNNSYLIGDRWRDIGCAANSKIYNSILIYNKNYLENSFQYKPKYICNNFLQSLKIILKKERLLTN